MRSITSSTKLKQIIWTSIAGHLKQKKLLTALTYLTLNFKRNFGLKYSPIWALIINALSQAGDRTKTPQTVHIKLLLLRYEILQNNQFSWEGFQAPILVYMLPIMKGKQWVKFGNSEFPSENSNILTTEMQNRQLRWKELRSLKPGQRNKNKRESTTISKHNGSPEQNHLVNISKCLHSLFNKWCHKFQSSSLLWYK